MAITDKLTTWAISRAEAGRVPDVLMRMGIRHFLQQRLNGLPLSKPEQLNNFKDSFRQHMESAAIAEVPELANEQHYEIPADYFSRVLGPHRKYSSCYWDDDTKNLEQAEENALRITCEHAGLEGGQQVLELGCGWGSLSLWMASHHPNSQITAVSNSSSQREHIENQARQRGLTNLQVITADVNHFHTDLLYDRILSVEMFEHLRNWPQMFNRINYWLKPQGHFFMHVFCHRTCPYLFEDQDSSDWMSRYFFSGGMMPSEDLPAAFPKNLRLLDQWRWNGNHYSKTLEAWLQRQDSQRDDVMAILRQVYDKDAGIWFVRWRLFYMACSELFRFNQGNEWYVGHYLLGKPQVSEKEPLKC